MTKRVVVTGIGLLTPLGRTIESNKQALEKGENGIDVIKSFDTTNYKSRLGAEVDNDLIDRVFSNVDRASDLLFTACKDALKSATFQEQEIAAPLILGTTLGGMLSGQSYHRDLLLRKQDKNERRVLEDSLTCHQAPRIARKLNLYGESLVINNACASGLCAIGSAFQRIRQGQCVVAIAGGYDVMSDFTHAGFSSLELVTAEKCSPFDRNRNGLILGEGAGIMVLEEMHHALKREARIFAEIIGYGQTSDAYHITKPDPDAAAAIQAIKAAMNIAGINSEEIDYVNAHGTGTKANDAMEAKAIRTALGNHGAKVPVSSTKPLTGHLLGGAGSVEAIFSIISIDTGMMPENLNYENADPECELNIISGGSKNAQLNIALSNSFGFGGSNGAILIKRYKNN